VIGPLPGWDSEETARTFHNGLYMGLVQGRTMQKCADDLERYKELIEDTEVDVVVETGTRYGGSALWFNLQGVQVISIDTEPQVTKVSRRADTERGEIQYITGNSTDPAVVSRVRQLTAGRRTLVSLDSDHHAPHVFDEIQAYGPLVTRGCHLVVEDACFDLWEGEDSRRGGRRIPEIGGALKAINLAALDRDPRFKRDEAIEAWTPISHSPCGWWERV
jgi:cephalosporin hydroxylase